MVKPLASIRSRREKGQSLILFVIALPVILVALGVVVDGARLFVDKQHLQNAADAASLAAASQLPASGTCTGPDTTSGTCLYNVLQYAEQYSGYNNGPTTLHACSGTPDTNCYQTPYNGSNQLVQVRLKDNVNTFFAHWLGLTNVDVSSKSAGSAAALTSTSTTPGSTVTNSNTITNTTTTSIPGNNNFAYAASTSCSAITINGSETFSGIWSNGGIDNTHSGTSAGTALVGNGACQFQNFSSPASPTPTTQRLDGGASGGAATFLTAAVATTGATALTVDKTSTFAAGQTLYIDSGSSFETATIKSVSGSTVTLNSPLQFAHPLHAIVTNADWPLGLPDPPTSCISASPNQISNNWPSDALAASPSGAKETGATVTLTTSVSNGFQGWTVGDPVTVSGVGVLGYNGSFTVTGVTNTTITYTDTTGLAASGGGTATHPPGVYCYTGNISFGNPTPSITGYEFISLSGDISQSNNGASFTGPATSPSILFYAVEGQVMFSGNTTILGGSIVLAPSGQITYTGASNTDTGFLESQTIVINNNGTTFTGSGPGTGGGGTSTTYSTTTTYTTTTNPAVTNTVTSGTTVGLNQ